MSIPTRYSARRQGLVHNMATMDGQFDLFAALDTAGDGAFAIDQDQTIVYWNAAAQEILGYPAEEVTGRKCWEVLEGRDDRRPWLCHQRCHTLRVASAGGSVGNYDLCVRARSGEMRWINVSILSFASTEQDKSLLVVHLFRDATSKRRSTEFLRAVLRAAQRLNDDVAPPLPPPSPSPEVELSGRELEILVLLAHGLGTQQIAATLSISPATARNHIQTILSKLQVHSRIEAVAYAIEHGFDERD